MIKPLILQSLQKIGTPHFKITKSFIQNNHKETQEVVIQNWNEELKEILSIDFEKFTKDNYAIHQHNNETIYTALNPDSKVQSLYLKADSLNGLEKLVIKRSVNNLLYHSEDTLLLIPASQYRITKSKKTLFFSKENYSILGLWE